MYRPRARGPTLGAYVVADHDADADCSFADNSGTLVGMQCMAPKLWPCSSVGEGEEGGGMVGMVLRRIAGHLRGGLKDAPIVALRRRH